MPEQKRQKSLETREGDGGKNVRVNRIIERLLNSRPSQKTMDAWSDTEPEFPTFPTPSLREKAKRQKKSRSPGIGSY